MQLASLFGPLMYLPNILTLQMSDQILCADSLYNSDWLDLLGSYRAVYLHCPRDLSRSSFWTSAGGTRVSIEEPKHIFFKC